MQGCKCQYIFLWLPRKLNYCSQPNVRTIEGVLFDALVKAGAVSDDNADDPVKVSYVLQ